MQANVNLDALLEKMKAELERVRNPVDVEKILKCAEAIKPLIEERETERLLLEIIGKNTKHVTKGFCHFKNGY